METFPVHAVTSWLGNTPDVALRHYLMVTNDRFEAAVNGIAKAAQNPAQQAHAVARRNRRRQGPRMKKPRFFRGLRVLAIPRDNHKWRGQDSNLRPRGYEPRELPGCSTPR
jgi:hypothetical protein